MEETIYLVDEEEDGEEVRTAKKSSEMLFVRGMISLFDLLLHGRRKDKGKKNGKEKRGARE